MEPQKEEKKEEEGRESRYVSYFANSMSNRSQWSACLPLPQPLPLPPLFFSPLSSPLKWPRARWSPPGNGSAMGNGMCQRRIPLSLPSRYLRNARDRKTDRPTATTDYFMCAAFHYCLLERRGPQDDAAERLLKSGTRRARKNDKRRRKTGKDGRREGGRGHGPAAAMDGVSNNASFMVLLCCVRKQIIECGERRRERERGCGIKFARVRPRVTNRGGEREEERVRGEERGI